MTTVTELMGKTVEPDPRLLPFKGRLNKETVFKGKSAGPKCCLRTTIPRLKSESSLAKLKRDTIWM